MAQWVLDSCMLYHAAGCGRRGGSEAEEEQARTALLALGLIAQGAGQQIAEDRRGRIAAEYARCWKKLERSRGSFPSKDAAHNFWYALWGRARLTVEGHVPEALKELLRERNMKEEGDIAFIEAAAGTVSRLLATEDFSDYTADVCEHLQRVLGIEVLSYANSLTRAAKD